MSSSADIRKKIANIAAKRAAVEREVSDASRRQATKHAEHAKKAGQGSEGVVRIHARFPPRQAESATKAALSGIARSRTVVPRFGCPSQQQRLVRTASRDSPPSANGALSEGDKIADLNARLRHYASRVATSNSSTFGI